MEGPGNENRNMWHLKSATVPLVWQKGTKHSTENTNELPSLNEMQNTSLTSLYSVQVLRRVLMI